MRRSLLCLGGALSALFALSANARAAQAKGGTDGPQKRRNVLGTALQPCCPDPNGKVSGYARNGLCQYFAEDAGAHVVCAQVTEAFLDFTGHAGNDLRTPRPEYHFAGLVAGDPWCLCVGRWRQALQAGVAPPVVLEATDEAALRVVSLDELRAHAVAKNGGDAPHKGAP